MILRWSLPISVIALLVIGIETHGALSAEQRTALLDEAQALYDRGIAILPADPDEAMVRFRDAAARYGQLEADGLVSAPLQYNLGNAWLQAGDVGRAILHYRRAAVIDPAVPGLEHNLASARALRRDQFAPRGDRALADALFGWHRQIPWTGRMICLGSAWAAFWLVWALGRLPGRSWWLAGLAILWAGAGTSISLEWLAPPSEDGVLLAEEAVVRKGNGVGFEPQFAEPLGAGVEFRIRETRGAWLHIELPDGHDGWIRAADAGRVAG